MNVNFGLFPPIAEPRFDEAGKRLSGPERGLARKRALSARAERDLARWVEERVRPGPSRRPSRGRGIVARAECTIPHATQISQWLSHIFLQRRYALRSTL